MLIDKLRWSDNNCTVGRTNFWCILDADGMRYIRTRCPEARFSATWGGHTGVAGDVWNLSGPEDLERVYRRTGRKFGGFYVDGSEKDVLFHTLLREFFPAEWTERYWTP